MSVSLQKGQKVSLSKDNAGLSRVIVDVLIGYKLIIRARKKMKINQKNTIENDIVGIDISVEVLGTADLTSEQELELLHNYNKIIEFNKIQFKGNMRMENNIPVVTDDPVDGTNVVEVVIPDVINEQFIVDEDLHITFSRDVTKFPETELNEIFSKREMLGQAKAILFATRIKEAIAEKLAEIRALSNTFEGEESYTL